MSAQAEIENAVEAARSCGLDWSDFIAQAREVWLAALHEEVRHIEREEAP